MGNKSAQVSQSNESSQTGTNNFQSEPKNAQFENNNYQSRADKLEERLIDFAVRIVRLSTSLPRTPAGKHIAGQILRSGTLLAGMLKKNRDLCRIFAVSLKTARTRSK